MVRIDIANNNLLFLFEINGTPIYLTETIRNTWVIMAIMIIIAVIVKTKLRHFKEKPEGFQNVVEIAVDFIANFTRNTLGEKLAFLDSWFFTVFFFILFSNLSGLVAGTRPPTGDIATTVPLALTTFIIIHAVGIKFQKGEYFKAYLKPFFLFLPMNLIGEISKPLSLSFRLFGNVLGGIIVMQVMYSMLPFVLRFIIPGVGHIYFDLFSGAIQTYVFTILSLTFIQLNSVTD